MSSLDVVRRCSRCQDLRPATEMFCQGSYEGQLCEWPLSGEDLVDPTVAARVPAQNGTVVPGQHCHAGHLVSPGDLLCPICGAEVDAGGPVADNCPPKSVSDIAGWTVLTRLNEPHSEPEKYRVCRESDGRQGILSLHSAGVELDASVYSILQTRIDRDYCAEVFDFGRWEGRAYEVNEEIEGGAISDLTVSATDLPRLRHIVKEMGEALASFTEVGLRHRAIRPEAIRIRSAEPLDLVITDFVAARLSDLDLDVEPVAAVSVFTAPEAVMGGVASASDWWGLGMIILHLITKGECFRDVNTQVFLIHVLSNGAPIPGELDPQVDILLRGLLALDRSQRWQWPEVMAWLDGQSPSAPQRASSTPTDGIGPTISLGNRSFRDIRSFTLEAARTANWPEACELLNRGVIASWADDCSVDKKVMSALRLTAQSVNVPVDYRLGLALKLLNPSLPFLVRETIIDPHWILSNPEQGFELISGPTLDLLRRLNLDSEAWLRSLAARAAEVRQRAKELKIELDEQTFKICALSSSRSRLAQRWAQQRSLFPDTDHAGLAALMERRQLSDEDLHILVAAAPGQFQPANEILDETRCLAAQVDIDPPVEESMRRWLALSRRDIYAEIDTRIDGFARCGQEKLDLWADQLRLDRRIPLAEALLLLEVPCDNWLPPQHQEYVSSLLGFFEKRVVGAVLRGPLIRMTIGKTTPRVDVMELGVDRDEASALVERLLQRTDQSITVNPEAFAESTTIEGRMRNLVSRASMYRRDTGVNGLYMGFPFLRRQDRDRNIRPHLAPILLWPLKIETAAGQRGFFSLAYDTNRDVMLNPALEGLLGAQSVKAWQSARDDLLGRSKLSIADAVDAFGILVEPAERRLRRLPDLKAEIAADEVICSSVLFHVTFVGQSIAQDLRMLRSTPPDKSALASMVRIGASTPATSVTESASGERYILTASDPSQEEAVSLSTTPPGLLIQGPPGTGKSQTIVNLVADSVGQEKSVLIICQKLQALSVVRKRLVAEGLVDRLVMVTDVNADRRTVLEDVRSQLEALPTAGKYLATNLRAKREELTRRIRALEDEIDGRYRSFHRFDEISGTTYRKILGVLVGIEDSAEVPIIDVVRLRRLFSLRSAADIADVEQSCEALASLWLAACYEESPLAAVEPFPLDDATMSEFQDDFADFVAKEVTRIDTVKRTTPGIDVDDPAPVADWLREHEVLLSGATPRQCATLKLHYGLFVKYRFGNEYLKLLERIIAVEEDWPSPCIVVPELVTSLGSVDIATFEQIAEECQEVAMTWLAARFEGSPLSVLKEFSGPDSIFQFRNAFDAFQKIESARDQCNAVTVPDFETSDPDALNQWLTAYEQIFLSGSNVHYAALSRFYVTFTEGEGDRFLTVIEGLRDCQEKSNDPPLDVPALESLLASVDEDSMREAAAYCESVAELWWDAHFEGSALSVLATFSATEKNVRKLQECVSAFSAAEAARDASLKLPSTIPQGAEHGALQSWLEQHEATLQNVEPGTCLCVSRLITLFSQVDSQDANALQAALNSLIVRLEELTTIGVDAESAELASQFSAEMLDESILEAGLAREHAVPWWTYKALRQVLARRRLRRLFHLDGALQNPQRLFAAVSSEYQFRQMRQEATLLTEQFNGETHVSTAVDLLTDLRRLAVDITRSRELVRVLVACPAKLDVVKICQDANAQLFRNLAAALRNEFKRQTAARGSLMKLDALVPWMSPEWISTWRSAIQQGQSNAERRAPLRQAWPTLSAYLQFREAATSMLIRDVFAALSPHRGTLEAFSSGDRSGKIGNVVVTHWLKAQKRKLEVAYPELATLRFETPGKLIRACQILREVRQMVTAVDVCPQRDFAHAVVLSGSADKGHGLLAHLRDSIARARSKTASQCSLADLAPWMTSSWMAECGGAIHAYSSNAARLEAISGTLSTIAAYQEFRTVIQLLSPLSVDVLKILSSRRSHFDKLLPTVVDKELRRIVLFHGFLSAKGRIEAGVPSLSGASPRTCEQCKLQFELLSEISPLVAAFESCPSTIPSKEAIASATPQAYEKLVIATRGAVERAHSRNKSVAALEVLKERMTPVWFHHRMQLINDGRSDGNLEGVHLLHAELPRLRPYQMFCRRAANLSPLQLEAFAILAAHRQLLHDSRIADIGVYLKNVVRREAFLGWKARLEGQHPALVADQREVAVRKADLDRLDKELKEVNRKIITTPPNTDGLGASDKWQDITRFSGPRAKRLREFFRSGKELGLLKLRPVWLMIPDIASHLLPLEPGLFDLVIYDEASQMPVEHAVPSLFRSRLVVVSGDEKQMPPTSAFKSRLDVDEEEPDDELPDEDAGEDELQAFEETWNRREIKDCPDLLHLAQSVLRKTTLQIHYRSDFRELIAFSNAAFYNNDLSVPKRHAESETQRERPIEYIDVNGLYSNQSNVTEADKVVELLANLWKGPAKSVPSVGIVTFNMKQADLIEAQLEAKAEGDAAFQRAYARESERIDNDEDMSLFIKNVENVQGDERDVIIFSTTFGRNATGTFRRNFGVLGQKGGERRLNVAVTRARKKIMVVTSMPVAEISDMLASRRRPQSPRDYLQAYLEYARLVSDGQFDAAQALLDRFVTGRSAHSSAAAEDGILQSIDAFIRSLGHKPSSVGVDPVLGVDFAIPDFRTGGLGMGIDCDPPQHRLLDRARPREIWRKEMLERSYLAVQQISPYDWYHDRLAERKRLQTRLEAVLGGQV